jgi:hypothetical protein
MKRTLTIVVATSLFLAGCVGDHSGDIADVTSPPPVETPARTTTDTSTPTTTTVPGSAFANRVRPIGSALYDPQEHTREQSVPTTIAIERLGIAQASIIDVGVADNGEMEIPGADNVGWYRFNASPGGSGSSVLAAHISFNGSPGVFRYLDESEVGDVVVIGFDDGSEARFEIVEVTQYNKGDLPKNRVFAKTGDPVLTLITCGGDFNRSLRSYEDNIVAYAVPMQA